MLRVKAADELWNVRSITGELRRRGPEAWAAFHAGAVEQLWFHRSVSNVVSRRLPGPLADELRVAVGDPAEIVALVVGVAGPADVLYPFEPSITVPVAFFGRVDGLVLTPCGHPHRAV